MSDEPTQNNWKFDEGDVVREELERFAPGGLNLDKSEYRVKRLLLDEHTGDRFYYVDTEHDGQHLYTGSVIENSHELIPVSESEMFEGEIEE